MTPVTPADLKIVTLRALDRDLNTRTTREWQWNAKTEPFKNLLEIALHCFQIQIMTVRIFRLLFEDTFVKTDFLPCSRHHLTGTQPSPIFNVIHSCDRYPNPS